MRIVRPLLASAAAIGGLLLVPGAAGAQTCTYPEQCAAETVVPLSGNRAAGAIPAAAPAATPARADSSGTARRGSLPVTGGDVAGLAVLGAAAVGAGAVVTVAGRRKA